MDNECNDEESPGENQVSRSLLSRINRLDSLMKRLRGKKNLWGKGSQDDGKCMPLNVAVQETCAKGSLLDRIASLEDRLVQLCLEIESYRRSCSSSKNTSSEASSSSNDATKRERICSYPTFDNKPNTQPKQKPQVSINKFESEKETPLQQPKVKLSNSIKQQQKLQGNTKDRKTGRNGKKSMAPSWPHLRILGC